MRHHILVKWKDGIARPDYREIQKIFDDTLAIPGIIAVTLHPNIIHKPNRYDLMILICMDKSALPAYDASEPHHRWKQQYGDMIETKAIFDCE